MNEKHYLILETAMALCETKDQKNTDFSLAEKKARVKQRAMVPDVKGAAGEEEAEPEIFAIGVEVFYGGDKSKESFLKSIDVLKKQLDKEFVSVVQSFALEYYPELDIDAINDLYNVHVFGNKTE